MFTQSNRGNGARCHSPVGDGGAFLTSETLFTFIFFYFAPNHNRSHFQVIYSDRTVCSFMNQQLKRDAYWSLMTGHPSAADLGSVLFHLRAFSGTFIFPLECSVNGLYFKAKLGCIITVEPFQEPSKCSWSGQNQLSASSVGEIRFKEHFFQSGCGGRIHSEHQH